MFKRKIRLPISVKEYEQLVNTLVKRYGFEEPEHVAAVISVAIRHIDNQTAHTTLEYLRDCVWKQMANHVASHKGDLIRHKSQVDQMVSMFKKDPNNQQILDELKKYADNGFEYAKTELSKLESIIPLTPPKDPFPISLVPPIEVNDLPKTIA